MSVTYRYLIASGRHVGDCHILASRHHEELGPARSSGEFYLLRSHQGALHVVLHDRRWLTSMWRAPSGCVFVVASDGTVARAAATEPGAEHWGTTVLPAVLTGVWGLHDDLVFAAGLRANAPVLFQLVNGAWVEIACPGYVRDMVFVDEQSGILCGHDGLLARWDGVAWQRLPSPVTSAIVGVTAASREEMYAQAGDYGILEGSPYGWVEQARLHYVITALAAHRGRLWVSVHGHDLCTFQSGVLTPRHVGFSVVQIDAREHLLAASTKQVGSSEDGETFAMLDLDRFVTVARYKEPWWMSDPELRDLGDAP
jgi:hypothetical protein